MALHVLSARGVQTAAIGSHSDGGGLFLAVSDSGASWVLRYTAPNGRRREMGLGAAQRSTLAAAGESLALARRGAEKARKQIANGIDPIAARQSARQAAQASEAAAKAAKKAEAATLARVARKYHEEVIEPQRTDKHAAQWIASLEANVPAEIWHSPIDTVEAVPLLDALIPLRKRVPETCDRVRQRLEVVFDHAEFLKLRVGNPARIIKRKLAERPRGKAKVHFAALPYPEVPAFMASLRRQPSVAARALEFAVLCVARTSEVPLGAVTRASRRREARPLACHVRDSSPVGHSMSSGTIHSASICSRVSL
jgi:Arm DNA-binding domain